MKLNYYLCKYQDRNRHECVIMYNMFFKCIFLYLLDYAEALNLITNITIIVIK